jgi:adenylate cyclase
MTEEIITNLAQIRELKVIARTTVMAYKQTNKSVRQIGRELGVNYILEGSVRKASNKLRISAQLIRAADESHVWAQDYDRELKDVFSLQDEVSSAIASKLKLNFSGDSLLTIETSRPENLDAYEYQLKAKYIVDNLYAKSGNEDDFQKAIELALKSVEADPRYALGFGALVSCHEVHYQWTQDPQDLKKMNLYADKAYSLNSDLVQTNNAKAWVLMRTGQYDLAYPFLKKAMALDPKNVRAGANAAYFSLFLGLPDQAIALSSRTIEYDPLSIWLYAVRGCSYAYVGKSDEALVDFDRAKQLGMVPPGIIWCYASSLLMKKRYDEADKVLTHAEQRGLRDVRVQEARALYHALLGNRDRALATSRCAWVLSFLREKDQALSKLEEEMIPSKERRYLEWHSYPMLISFPCFAPFRGDPRFEEIVSRQKRKYEFFSEKYRLP